MNYDVNYFIEKFEAIPEDKWTTRRFIDENGCMCALGHCGVTEGDFEPFWTEESRCLNAILGQMVPEINDGDGLMFESFGSTPKKRILYALKQKR